MKPAFEIDTCIIEENKKIKEKSFGTTTGSHVLFKKKKKNTPLLCIFIEQALC